MRLFVDKQAMHLIRPIASAALVAILAACGADDAPSSPLARVQNVVSLSPLAGAQPHLAKTPDGQVVISWQNRFASNTRLHYATLSTDDWSEPVEVVSGSNWFVNWADFPSVSPIDESLWAAHWLQKKPGGTYAYDVNMSLSTDAGKTWSLPFSPHSDGTPTEHGFATLYPDKGGVGAIWLDGRQMSTSGHDHSESEGGPMTLRSAVVGADGEVHDKQVVDDRVCDCCQTDVAVGANGPIVIYRNRTQGEIRDIYVATRVNDQWQNRVISADGWNIAGCPVNGPAIDAIDRTVVAAWFTAADDMPRVRVAWSDDAGHQFDTPVDIDVDTPLGAVDIALVADGKTAAISWLRNIEQSAQLCLRRVHRDGAMGAIQCLSELPSRRSGFPQMIFENPALVMAWADASADVPQVQSARLPLPPKAVPNNRTRATDMGHPSQRAD